MKKRFLNMLQKTVAMAMAVAVLGMLPMGQVSAANANGAIAQGVDASKHNGAVNWGQVAASGMQFAFIKVGSTKMCIRDRDMTDPWYRGEEWKKYHYTGTEYTMVIGKLTVKVNACLLYTSRCV